MDKVAVATLNATVLAIFEAVFVILVARARSMRMGLERLVGGAQPIADRVEVNTRRLGPLGIERSVESFIPAKREERERLLEMLLSPADVMREAQEEADVKDLEREFQLLRRVDLELYLQIKDDIAAGQPVRELYPTLSDSFFKEAEAIDVVKARGELQALLSDTSLDKPPVPEVPEVPAAEGDQGLVLAAVLAGLLHEPLARKRLSDESAIERWLGNARRFRRIRSLLDQRRDVANGLIDAAVAQQEANLDPASATASTTRSEIRVLKSLLPGVAAILRELAGFEAELTERLRVYRRDRPAASSMVLVGTGVVIGMIGGAVVFGAGVIAPILWAGCPKILYAWIPAAWYTAVLVTLCVSVTRQAVQMGSSA